MKPYYEQDGIQIWHGDCRDVLPLLPPVDLVLTDPPWGIEGGKGNINTKRGKGNYESAFTDDEQHILAVVVPVLTGLIDTVRCVVLTPGFKYMVHFPPPTSFGCFYMPASVGMQTFGHGDAQPILYYGKNARGNNLVPCSYTLTEAPPAIAHPCPKPFKAWRRLLSNISREGQTVLDPFMGSGTTLRAAKDLGRHAIGIEIEERYCEIAVKRLAQGVLPLS